MRQLGLPLDMIARTLEGDARIAETLAEHQSYLEEQLVAIRTLRAQVGTVAELVRADGDAPAEDFLALTQKVIQVDETVKKYFSDAQLADLAERRERLGDAAITDVERRWGILIPRVEEAVRSGVSPESPDAQDMAREWMELLEQFHGGDEGLRDSLYRMHEENADEIEQQHRGPTPEQMEFIKRANAARQ